MDTVIKYGVLIVTVAVFIGGIGWGYRKGALKIGVSLAAAAIALVLVGLVTPHISDAILERTNLEKTVSKKCREILMPGESKAEADEAFSEADDSRGEQRDIIEKSDFPEPIQKLLIKHNNDKTYESLGIAKFSEYVGSFSAKMIANIIAFLAALIVIGVIMGIIVKAVGILGKLPIIGGMNRVAGAVVGFGCALVVVWLIFAVVTLMYGTKFGEACLNAIAGSGILSYLYEHNPLMSIFSGMM